MMKYKKITWLSFLFSIGSILIGGAVWQWTSTICDQRTFPPPGELFNVGKYKLHINRMGTGSPSVILDAGMGGNSLEWALIQPQIAKITTVCSFDRAGNGWSEEGSYPRTSLQIVEELHSLLEQAKVPGPYILVGHSFGGVNSCLFANQFPDETAGIILVDSAHEDQIQRLSPLHHSTIEKLICHRKLARFMASMGIVRFYNNLLNENSFLPNPTSKVYSKLQSTPKFVETVFDEYKNFPESLNQLKIADFHFGEKPLIVITAGRSFTPEECLEKGYSTEWLDLFNKSRNVMQKELLNKSTNSKQIIAKDSGHTITREQPQIIVDSIIELVNRINAGGL